LKSAPVHFFLATDFFVELSVTWMTLRAPAYLLALSAPCGRLPDQGRNESGVIVVSDTSSHLNAFVALRR
jgi:hypothetical protein